jgi:Flp pilus assembly protein TadB
MDGIMKWIFLTCGIFGLFAVFVGVFGSADKYVFSFVLLAFGIAFWLHKSERK